MRDLILFFCVWGLAVASVFGHTTAPPAHIAGKNPRLPAEGQFGHHTTTSNGSVWHRHHWCYDSDAFGPQTGEFQQAFFVRNVDPPPDAETDLPDDDDADPGDDGTDDTDAAKELEPPPLSAPDRHPTAVSNAAPPRDVASRLVREQRGAEQTEDGNSLQPTGRQDTDRSRKGDPSNLEVREDTLRSDSPSVAPKRTSNIVLTQVMFHTWTRAGGGGNPQWFELHNRGGDGTVKDFQLTFFPKGGGKLIIVLKDCPLASGETMIVTPSRVGSFLGHLWGHSQGVEKVYIDEDILNLKNNWVLTDSNGTVIYRRSVPWNWGSGEHARDALGRAAYRQAVDVIPSEPYTGESPIYYGNAWDAGNPPGWHVDVVPRAPRLLRKTATTWGALKQPKRFKQTGHR